MSCNLDAWSSNLYSFSGPNVHLTSIYTAKVVALGDLIQVLIYGIKIYMYKLTPGLKSGCKHFLTEFR